ncbi:MAG: serine/threonine protein kinase [Deltaproteobacteria bacterium]|nr:serine/threonine protein kinase [Deltaproteobacteria bacterium]
MGEVLDGRYRILKKLGEGGMGEVYAAEHIHIEKKFAIKLLRPEILGNPEAVTRFRQEARSSSSIGHRNIIAVEDFGSLSDGRIYMCMELLNGAALNDLITTPQPVDRLLNILIQTGHGLAAAHAKGIVHRDMKPENIFVTVGPNNEDVPKLLDFGIAKVAGNEGQNNLTRTGTIFGTPFYMAPEQALGNPVDARTRAPISTRSA